MWYYWNVIPENEYARVSFRLAAGIPEDSKTSIETAIYEASSDVDLEFKLATSPISINHGLDGKCSELFITANSNECYRLSNSRRQL